MSAGSPLIFYKLITVNLKSIDFYIVHNLEGTVGGTAGYSCTRALKPPMLAASLYYCCHTAVTSNRSAHLAEDNRRRHCRASR